MSLGSETELDDLAALNHLLCAVFYLIETQQEALKLFDKVRAREWFCLLGYVVGGYFDRVHVRLLQPAHGSVTKRLFVTDAKHTIFQSLLIL